MKKTEIAFNTETLPLSLKPFVTHASVFDSSSSEEAQTLYIKGAEPLFLKICQPGSLEREYRMAQFLHTQNSGPKAIAFESDKKHDYLLLEAVEGEDGTEAHHMNQPTRLVTVFGQYLRKLHAMSASGCPYPNRTSEMLTAAASKDIDLSSLDKYDYTPADDAVIHGDYCLPNVMMDNFEFRGYIDAGNGGVGDRHYDLFWGLWTLQYNFETDAYHELFLDAYGRDAIDPKGLDYFIEFIRLTEDYTL
ncbi:aminoglycoside 3'-phosphotransferase [Neobacillus mesonae]|nr:aminoglycoside 3'-phosphotransferase [Neobacillus mesonae]